MASTIPSKLTAKVQAKEDKPFHRVDDALNQAQELALRVERVVERMIGSIPKPTSDSAEEMPEGALHRIVQKATTTSSYIEDANDALDRLERTI